MHQQGSAYHDFGEEIAYGVKSDFHFTENKGQLNQKVYFHTKLHLGDIYFEKNTFTFDLYSAKDLDKAHKLRHARKNKNQLVETPIILRKGVYKMCFIGANTTSNIFAEAQKEGLKNYFIGNDQSKWVSGARSYKCLNYGNLYDNIDAKIYTKNNHLKYDFIVKVGGDPSKIKVHYKGVNNLKLTNGILEINLSHISVKELNPIAYQYINNQKQIITCEFILNGTEVSFNFPEGYDKSKDLIIDPTWVFSTLTGSTSDNWGFTATYDLGGNLYGGGIADGSGYPTTIGAYDVSFGGNWDAVITKFNPTGTALVYSTYIGGSDADQPHSLVTDPAGNLVIYGVTASTNFPTTSSTYDNSFNGGTWLFEDGIYYNNGIDIFITKLNSSGSALLGSTYIGGSSNDGFSLNNQLKFNYADHARGEVVLDDNNNIYITSSTNSTDFPTSSGAHQQNLGGDYDAIVACFSSDLSTLLWSTYLGGNSGDAGYSVRVNENNNMVAVCGGTLSSNIGATSGTIHSANLGGVDGYIATFDKSNGFLDALTYLGTSSYDQAYILEIDANGDIYVTGQTKGNYPVSAGVYSNNNSSQFIHKMNSTLTTTDFSTVFGSGSSTVNISITAFLVDNCENIYVAGWGGSTNNEGNTNNMPITANAIQLNTDGSDFYFIVLDRDAQSLLYGTYFGLNGGAWWAGEHVDGGTSRFDKQGIIYQGVCAGCGGYGFPTSPGAFSSTNNSSNCNYGAIKIDFDVVGVMAVASASPNTSGCAPLTVNFTNSSTANSYIWDFDDNGQMSTAINPTYTFNNPGVYNVMLIAIDSSTCNISDTTSLQINVTTAIPISTSNVTACDSYLWNGTSYTTSGTYTYTTTISAGCDSTAILNLTINPSTTSTSIVTTCDSYLWNGTIYTASGTYIDVSMNASGCSHTETLNLTINNSTSNTAAQTSCDSYTWVVNGTTYTSSGTYTDVSMNASGCSHTETLNLTTNPATYSYSTVTSCIPFLWNGTTYNTSGSYIFLTTDLNGCDSTATLNLTINSNSPTVSTSTDTSCIPYTWNGIIYDTSGGYTYTTVDANGCDSIANLVLTILDMTVFIPNTFTPNDDNINEKFRASYANVQDYEMWIYSRWGQLLFYSNKAEYGWDGTYKNRMCQHGVYGWKVKYSCNEEPFIKKGYLTLIR